MKDIKEILDKLKDISKEKYIKVGNFKEVNKEISRNLILNGYECQLLDYIINFQEENKALKHKINVVNREINNILWYNYNNDTTSGFGNVIREIKFYLSNCKTLEEFDKLQGSENND